MEKDTCFCYVQVEWLYFDISLQFLEIFLHFLVDYCLDKLLWSFIWKEPHQSALAEIDSMYGGIRVAHWGFAQIKILRFWM